MARGEFNNSIAKSYAERGIIVITAGADDVLLFDLIPH